MNMSNPTDETKDEESAMKETTELDLTQPTTTIDNNNNGEDHDDDDGKKSATSRRFFPR